MINAVRIMSTVAVTTLALSASGPAPLKAQTEPGCYVVCMVAGGMCVLLGGGENCFPFYDGCIAGCNLFN
jgi:hypothetical protein